MAVALRNGVDRIEVGFGTGIGTACYNVKIRHLIAKSNLRLIPILETLLNQLEYGIEGKPFGHERDALAR